MIEISGQEKDGQQTIKERDTFAGNSNGMDRLPEDLRYDSSFVVIAMFRYIQDSRQYQKSRQEKYDELGNRINIGESYIRECKNKYSKMCYPSDEAG